MALLLERLGPGFPPDAQKHAAEILAAVARSQVMHAMFGEAHVHHAEA